MLLIFYGNQMTLVTNAYLVKGGTLMHFIGIYSISDNTDKNYVEVLNKLKLKFQFVSLNDLYGGIDVLVIDESDSDLSDNNYEAVLKARSLFDGFLLLLTKNKTKVVDLVYLQLGVDGILREETDYEVTFIQVKRFLDKVKRSQRNNEKKLITKEINNSLKLNPQNISVIKNGDEEIELTNIEYQVLTLLMSQAGTTVPYREITKNVWHNVDKTKKSRQYLAANIVFKLRSKIGNNANGEKYIRTVRKKGYLFNEIG